MNSAIPGSQSVQTSAQAPAQSARSAAESERSNGDGGDNDGRRISNTFDTFNLGPAVGQNGWLGSGCGYSLSHIDATTTYPNAHFSGTNKPSKVLVVQNAPPNSDGCYDGLGSPPVPKPAGKEDSFTVPFPTWTVCGEACVRHYSAQWTITSSTGGYQPGIGMSLSPVYNNDGARMAYVGMEFVLNPHNNKPSLRIFSDDVRGVCTTGCPNTGPPPCLSCANFVDHDVKFVDPTKEHTIGLTMDFGPKRDRVVVTVDGEESWTGTGWSDYYTMDTESDPGGLHPQSRAVNDLLLHGNGSNGVGFLYRNVTVSTR
jgi:hypothetical protein